MKYLISIVTIFVIFISFGNFVSAHVLKYDGNIGAVLHIDPDDSPLAGQDSKIYLDFKDKSGRFDIRKCNCQAIISNNEVNNYVNFSTNTFYYNFPKIDVYTLEIIGKSTAEADFDSFDLKYDIRVATDANEKSNTIPIFLLLIIFSIIIITSVVIKKNFMKIRNLIRSKK